MLSWLTDSTLQFYQVRRAGRLTPPDAKPDKKVCPEIADWIK
jgi:hypothetical protein